LADCKNKPTALLPWRIDCVACQGKGSCSVCNNTGKHNITDCPLVYIDRDVWDTIRLVSFWQHGIPPVAGGSLDQSWSFIEAASFVTNEETYWKNKLGILT